jgi:enterochelin esterase-like enzyme
MRSASFLGALALLALPLAALAQDAQPTFDSSTVNPDHTVTFKYRDTNAAKAELSLEGAGDAIPMEKAADGTWTATSKPLAPQIYGYHFEVDGQPRLDPHQTRLTTNLLNLSNLLAVPGDTPQLWEPQPIPHGEIHHHLYTTSVVLGLPQNQSDFFVYTPPGYDPKAKHDYPVLYLLHGWSDRADGWTAVGQANLIFDSLLAAGKIKPMLVVMPLGYGEMSFVLGTHNVWNDPAAVDRNTDLFSKALLTEIIPAVAKEYHVSPKREDHAIVGLSMGGLESLTIGLTNPDKFAYVGGFSSAVHGEGYTSRLASLDPKSAHLKLLWIACGTEDHLIDPNRKFITFLKSKNMPVTPIETPGMHTWMVWRDNLIHFTPLLFQK